MSELRERLRQALIASARPVPLAGKSCVFCGNSTGPFALELVRFAQSVERPFPKNFVPKSESGGTRRGALPICLDCAPVCGRCGLPKISVWTRKMAEAVRSALPSGVTTLGNGYCHDHLHWGFVLGGYFKSVELRGDLSLAPSELNETHRRQALQKTAEALVGAIERDGAELYDEIRIELERFFKGAVVDVDPQSARAFLRSNGAYLANVCARAALAIGILKLSRTETRASSPRVIGLRKQATEAVLASHIAFLESASLTESKGDRARGIALRELTEADNIAQLTLSYANLGVKPAHGALMDWLHEMLPLTNNPNPDLENIYGLKIRQLVGSKQPK